MHCKKECNAWALHALQCMIFYDPQHAQQGSIENIFIIFIRLSKGRTINDRGGASGREFVLSFFSTKWNYCVMFFFFQISSPAL